MVSRLVNSAWKVIPVFESRSIPITIDFYTKKLGFELASIKPEEDEPDSEALYFCSMFIGKKADANFYFSKADTPESFKASEAMIALGTTEFDEYYVYLKDQAGVQIAEEVEDKPWGFRQFALKDPDGNLLTFFKFLEGGNPGTE